MTNHWNQNRSTFRKGEPMDHQMAKEFIGTHLKMCKYDVQYEYPLVDSLAMDYKHNYDVVAFKHCLVVEIDDPDLHSKPHKVANDKRAESYVDKFFPRATFLRLDKDELNSVDTVTEYMSDNFWPNVVE